MIEKIHRQNVEALIEQKHKPLLDIIKHYADKKNVDEALANWQGFGTTGEAIKKYLKQNVKQKSKPRSESAKAGDE